MKLHGKEFKPGPIPEDVYEDFIDIAYGRGDNLKVTKLWKRSYVRGFVCPDGYNKWMAFAYDGRRYLFLGTFSYDEVFAPEEEDWNAYQEWMLSNADRSPSTEAVNVIRALYLDDHNRDIRRPIGEKIFNDQGCLTWFAKYWDYVRWNEHGNECSLSEVGFDGFIDTFLNPDPYIEYLLPPGDEDERGKELAAGLMKIHRRLVG